MSLDYRQPQFLRHPTEGCVLRTTWDEGTQVFLVFVRYPGQIEYQVSYTTKLFNDATLQEQPITEKEYLDF